MAKKRFHYDAKGRLKGYSTDKYQPRFRDIWIGAVIFIVVSLIMRSAAGDEAKDTDLAASTQPVAVASSKATNADAPERAGATSDMQSLQEHGYFATQPRAENPSSYERDLKPYYEKECAAGDQSACDSLEAN